jgi:quercetin dioxygenase-like cupin family protein
MQISSVASQFSIAILAFAPACAGVSETILGSEPLILAPYDTAFVQNGSCPDGKVLKVTGAIRGLDRRKDCASIDRPAGRSPLTIGQAPAPHADELESVKAVFQRAIPTIPGKNLTAIVVSYPPGGRSPPHRHAKSAFIYAFVLSGAVRIGIGSEPPIIYRAGDSFYEEPGAHHTVSENASESQPANLLAVFIVDAEDRPLTLPDPPTERR